MEDVGMARWRHTAEEIVSKLRQVNVLTSQGRPVAEAVRAITSLLASGDPQARAQGGNRLRLRDQTS
jgi:hypothetical protein